MDAAWDTQHKKLVTTMLTYPWKCTVLHCNHLGNTWKPLVLMSRHFDYCLSASEGDNQSVRSSASVVSRCFPGGYNVKLYISRGRLAWWLLTFLHSDRNPIFTFMKGEIDTHHMMFEYVVSFHNKSLFRHTGTKFLCRKNSKIYVEKNCVCLLSEFCQMNANHSISLGKFLTQSVLLHTNNCNSGSKKTQSTLVL